MPALLKSVLELVLSDTGITAIATVLATALVLIVRVRKAKQTIAQVASFAYDAVNAIKDATPTKIDDKAAIALKIIRDELNRDLSATEAAVAQATFDARHTQENMAKALADKALAVRVVR